MKYYLVDINVDVSTYKSQIVYKWHGDKQFLPSTLCLEKARLNHHELSSIAYKHIVTDIPDEELIVLTLQGVVRFLGDHEHYIDALTLSENVA